MEGKANLAKGEIVSIAPCEVEVLPVELEGLSLDRHESLGDIAGNGWSGVGSAQEQPYGEQRNRIEQHCLDDSVDLDRKGQWRNFLGGSMVYLSSLSWAGGGGNWRNWGYSAITEVVDPRAQEGNS